MSARRHHHQPRRTQTGFTVIEVMVVVMLMVLLTLTASSVFITMLSSRARSSSYQLVRSEGAYAISQIEFLIRNAVKILPTVSNPSITCRPTTPLNEIVLQSSDGGLTRFYKQVDNSDGGVAKIASNSGVYLTSGAVTVDDGPNFTCIDNPDSGSRFILVDFTLSKNGRTQKFSSTVNMRNY